MIAKIATLAFYGGFAWWVFWHNPVALFVAGIGAAILAILMIIAELKNL
jgi:hypothetical protein